MTTQNKKFEDCPEWKQLNALVGEWEGEGLTFSPEAAEGPAKKGTRVWASDRFDWSSEGSKLIHHWHWKIEGRPDFDGAEVISFDPEAGKISARMDDSSDHHLGYAITAAPDGTLVYTGEQHRARFSVGLGAGTLTSKWEYLRDGERWEPLCELRWSRMGGEQKVQAAG